MAKLNLQLSLPKMPIVNFLVGSPEPQVPLYDLNIVSCENCGFVRLLNGPESGLLYENCSTPSSWKYEPHLEHLVTKLVSFVLPNSRILDVGCNDGKFLLQCKAAGFHRLVGVEPTTNMAAAARENGLDVHQMFFTSASASLLQQKYGCFDVIVLRQVLEHIQDLNEIALAVKTVSRNGTLLILEVPDFDQNIQNRDYSLWEEHTNYFNLSTLRSFLAAQNYSVVDSYQSLFCGTNLTVFATYEQNESQSPLLIPSANQRIIEDYFNFFNEFKSNIAYRLSEKSREASIVLHGVGARSSFWLNATEAYQFVSVAADDQPAKQGKYMPKSNIPIVSVEEARQLKPSLVLLGVNTENEQRVTPFWDGISPVVSILPPSDLLLWRDLLASPQAG